MRIFLGLGLAGWALLVGFCVMGGVCGADVLLKDGRRLEGRVEKQDADMVYLRSSSGLLIPVKRSRVAEVFEMDIPVLEARGDEAFSGREYYRALDLYSQAAEERVDGRERILDKIARTQEVILEQESRLYRRLFDDANALAGKGEFGRAREVLSLVVDKASLEKQAGLLARRYMAHLYFRENLEAQNLVRYSAARVALEKAVEVDPTFALAYLELGQHYEQYSSDAELALEAYREGVGLARAGDPLRALIVGDGSRYPHLVLSEFLMPEDIVEYEYRYYSLLYERGKKQEAADGFRRLLEEYPEDLSRERQDDVVRQLGNILTDIDPSLRVDRKQALNGLNLALEMNPELARAWFLKGRIYFADGNTSAAIDSFTRTLDITEGFPEAHFYRARAFLRDGRPSYARQDLEKELEMRERYHVRNLLGQVSLEGMDYDDALGQFNRAIQMEPELTPAFLGRAASYRFQALLPNVSDQRRGVLQALAWADVEKVLAKDPESIEALLIKANLLKDQERDAEGEALFEQIAESLQEQGVENLTVEERGYLAEVYVQLGDLQVKKKNFSQAETRFKKALDVSPDFAKAYQFLGDIAMKSNQLGKAESYYLQAIEKAPENPDYELQLGILYQQNKKIKEALERYQAHRDKGGADPRVEKWIDECKQLLSSK